jgi:tetratricopeptide (TPR) repeat protein
MVDWSYDLLDENERLLLRRSSVFPSSFSFEAARSVCGEEQDPSQSTLVQVVERSLIATDDSTGTRRYRLLETIRRYAADRAVEAGETDGLRDALLAWCGGVVDAWWREGRKSSELDAIEVEHDNIRAALTWSADGGDAETGVRIVGQMWRFWYIRGYLTEGRSWVETMLEAAPDASEELRADAMHCGGILCYRLGDYEAAERFHEASLALRRRLDDAAGIAASLNNLGLIAFERRELEKAREMFQGCLQLRRELGDQRGLASPLNNLGLVADALDDHAGARAAYEESLALQRSFGDDWGVGLVLDNLGQLEQKQGNFGSAVGLHLEALDLWRLIGDDVSVADCLERLAGVAAAGGDSEDAAVLFGAAERIRETIGSPVGSRDREHYDGDVAKARAGLEDVSFRSAWDRGRGMDVEAAAKLAAGIRTRV